MQIPESLATCRQFILYGTDKKPRSPHTGQLFPEGSGWVTNPAEWADAVTVQAAAAKWGCGVGFVFTVNDPFFFFDLDDALQPDGTWSPLAVQMCQVFAGCYIEVSRSGTGLHILGSAAAIPHSCKNIPLKIELYTELRYCALTGTHAQGTAGHVVQAQLDWLVNSYFPISGATDPGADWTDGPVPEWSGPADDDELIAKMLAARGSVAAAFGGRASLRELWEGNADALGRAYPETGTKNYGYDHSSADAALCQHLAFWTGKDCERIDRLFRQSALYREKWERPDYRKDTILHAARHCSTVLGNRPAATPAGDTPPSVMPQAIMSFEPGQLRDGFQFLAVTQQQAHFTGCVYVRDAHKVFTPDGTLLTPERFRSTYGGYVFAVDMINDKTTKSAWEAFTESQGFNFPKAHSVCFRPEYPPGTLVQEEGYLLINTFIPIETRRVEGDPAPFLGLLSKLLPVEHDQKILLSYMAALVQNPGVKFQWWPVIQGTEGNGKSAIIRILNHAVGNRYTHIPNADDMARTGNKFNAWVQRKLFIGIEEMYVPDRRDFLEAFKTTVTNDRIQIEGKGADQIMGDNRANGVICTNHRDGVPVTIDTRRYAIFFTAQQSKEDKVRDGMTGLYFPDLYDWLKGRNRYAAGGIDYGYSVINNFLRTYKVESEFNPCELSQEAPITSTTGEAVRASMGSIEQEVIEAIEEGRPGFAGGWISSKAFDLMLENRHAVRSIPINRRRELLRGLGYDWHPALKDGRVSNPIPDPVGAGKPRLYLRAGHIAMNLQTPAEVARMYLEAQAGTGAVAMAFSAAQGGGA